MQEPDLELGVLPDLELGRVDQEYTNMAHPEVFEIGESSGSEGKSQDRNGINDDAFFDDLVEDSSTLVDHKARVMTDVKGQIDVIKDEVTSDVMQQLSAFKDQVNSDVERLREGLNNVSNQVLYDVRGVKEQLDSWRDEFKMDIYELKDDLKNEVKAVVTAALKGDAEEESQVEEEEEDVQEVRPGLMDRLRGFFGVKKASPKPEEEEKGEDPSPSLWGLPDYSHSDDPEIAALRARLTTVDDPQSLSKYYALLNRPRLPRYSVLFHWTPLVDVPHDNLFEPRRRETEEDEHAARVEIHRKYVLEGNEPYSCFDGSSHSSGYSISHHLSQDVCTNEGINLSKHILDLFEESLKSALGEQYEAGNRPSIAPLTGDYQCYHPLGILSDLQGKGNEVHADAVGQAISKSLTNSQIVQSFCVEGLGVSFRLSDAWMEKSITNLVQGGIKQWAPKLLIKKALVDFSSPESSAAMDFLHFRAAIIGDSIARMLEFSGVKAMRASHVTAYGSEGWQLIRSSEWKPMPVDTCQQLREFYTLAGIQWQDEEGTFYSVKEEALKNLRNDMKDKFLVMPRGDILTELISLEYRLKYQKADWIIYISHATHKDHFFQTFKVAESAGWHGGDNDYPKFSHISLQKKCDFGLAMQFNDVFKGVKSRSENLLKFVLLESEYQRVKTSHSVAYASLKYAILKKTFDEIAFNEIDVKHLFNRKGKTAVYLLRTYSWISGMLDDDVHREELKKNNAVVVEHVGARALALYLLRFPEVIQKALDSLSAAVLCDYVYDLAMIFTQKFYAEYAQDLQFARVHFGHQEQRLKEMTAAAMSRRTLLFEATRIVMEKCLELLGLEPVSCLLF